jgi:hypothetical protein
MKLIVGFFTMAAFAISPNLHAVTLDAVDSGWYASYGVHNDDNTNYLTGGYVSEYRSFFVFDLAGVQNVPQATLRIFNPPRPADSLHGYQSPHAFEELTIFDVSTPVNTLRAGDNQQLATFNDLGTGISYGSALVSSASNNNFVDVPLNGAARAALASATGLFSLGGAITTLSPTYGTPATYQYVFGESGPGPVQLVILPEPTAALMLAVGLIIACQAQRRPRRGSSSLRP